MSGSGKHVPKKSLIADSGKKAFLPAAKWHKKLPDVTTPQGGWDSTYPAWSLTKIDLDGPYGWNKVENPSTISEIIKKLSDLERRTWAEILRDSKKHNHAVETNKMCSEAQGRLRDLSLDDVDCLISFRLSSRKRVWGGRLDHIFYVLWWDPKHQVCPSLPD